MLSQKAFYNSDSAISNSILPFFEETVQSRGKSNRSANYKSNLHFNNISPFIYESDNFFENLFNSKSIDCNYNFIDEILLENANLCEKMDKKINKKMNKEKKQRKAAERKAAEKREVDRKEVEEMKLDIDSPLSVSSLAKKHCVVNTPEIVIKCTPEDFTVQKLKRNKQVNTRNNLSFGHINVDVNTRNNPSPFHINSDVNLDGSNPAHNSFPIPTALTLIDTFLKNQNCSIIIFTSIIFKLIDENFTFENLPFFSIFSTFSPKTHLLAYLYLMKFTIKNHFKKIQQLIDMYLTCCIVASKTQIDGNLSNDSMKSSHLSIFDINYLEGLLINELSYNLTVKQNELEAAILDMQGIYLMKTFSF